MLLTKSVDEQFAALRKTSEKSFCLSDLPRFFPRGFSGDEKDRIYSSQKGFEFCDLPESEGIYISTWVPYGCREFMPRSDFESRLVERAGNGRLLVRSAPGDVRVSPHMGFWRGYMPERSDFPTLEFCIPDWDSAYGLSPSGASSLVQQTVIQPRMAVIDADSAHDAVAALWAYISGFSE